MSVYAKTITLRVKQYTITHRRMFWDRPRSDWSFRDVLSIRFGFGPSTHKWIHDKDLFGFRIESMIDNLRKKTWKDRLQRYSFDAERIDTLGPDLAVAHYIVELGGAIKFVDSPNWIELIKGQSVKLPSSKIPELRLEAVDCTGTDMITQGLDILADLEHLQYLNLSKCKHVDDYALDKLLYVRESLVFLDLSGCPKITERGLSSLHRLNKLRKLCLYDMPHIREAPLLAIMLEELVQNLSIEGIDYSDLDQDVKTEREMPSFLKDFDSVMRKKLRKTRRLTMWEAGELNIFSDKDKNAQTMTESTSSTEHIGHTMTESTSSNEQSGHTMAESTCSNEQSEQTVTESTSSNEQSRQTVTELTSSHEHRRVNRDSSM